MLRNENQSCSVRPWFAATCLAVMVTISVSHECHADKPGVAADFAIDAMVDFTGEGPFEITGLVEDWGQVRRGEQFMRDGEWWDRLLFIGQFGTFEIDLPLLAERNVEYPFEIIPGTGVYEYLGAAGTATGRTQTRTKSDPWWGSVIYIKTDWHMHGYLLP